MSEEVALVEPTAAVRTGRVESAELALPQLIVNPWPASPRQHAAGPTLADSAPFAFESARMAPRLHYYSWRVGEKGTTDERCHRAAE